MCNLQYISKFKLNDTYIFFQNFSGISQTLGLTNALFIYLFVTYFGDWTFSSKTKKTMSLLAIHVLITEIQNAIDFCVEFLLLLNSKESQWHVFKNKFVVKFDSFPEYEG